MEGRVVAPGRGPGTGGATKSRRLVLPAHTASCGKARRALVRFASALGLPEEQIYSLALALGEAVANAVTHGARGQGPGARIVVELAARDGRLVMSVADAGPGFQPAAVPPPVTDPEAILAALEAGQVPAAGRGLLLMREMTEEVEFTFPGTGTVCRLTHRMSERNDGHPPA